MVRITQIKKLGKRVYLTFKVWLLALVSILVLSVILGTSLLFFIPLTARYALIAVYLLFVEIMAYPVVHLITSSTGQIIGGFFYNRKHKLKEYHLQNKQQIANKMKVKYDKPIYLTDNPSVTSPFTNLFSRTIYFPSSILDVFHATEIEALFAHELAHIKYGFKFFIKILLTTLITWFFAFPLTYFAINPIIYAIAQFAFMMLILSPIIRQNEYLADWTSGIATAPEAIISVLDYFKAKSKGNGSTITHPSFQGRKKRIERLYDSDC